MISIKKYLSGGNGISRTEEGLREVVALLVRKLGESAVEADRQELDDFRREIASVHEALTPNLALEKMLIFTGAVNQSHETYNKRITRTIGNHNNDFQGVLKLLQDHLAALAGANSDSVERLGEIGKQMETSTGFKALQDLKLHLAQCLSGLRDEIEREKTASKALIEKLQIDVEGFRGPGGSPSEGGADPATGLPRQGECLTAIQTAIDKGTRHYAAVVVVSRVQPINARFGRAAGDQMLRKFKETVETNMVAPDRLFRWTGPAMVAILERPQPIANVRLMVKRMMEVRAEETFLVGGRSVMVPISASWAIFALEATVAASEKNIQAFIASQGCRDFA
jgi:GGDEF domain-containing protein